MSNFYMFLDRTTPVMVKGKRDELAIITNRGKSLVPQVVQNERLCELQDDTVYICGDLMESKINDDKYYIIAKQVSQTGAVRTCLKKINCNVNIVKLVTKYDSKLNNIGFDEVVTYSNIPSVKYTITANMKQYDAGILPNTVKKFILPVLNIELQQRIKVEGNNYQIIGIDNDKYNNMLEVQCSIDNR